jgi:hypothetical protein
MDRNRFSLLTLANTNTLVAAKTEANVIALFTSVSFVQPWLLLYLEQCAFFLVNAQPFSFVERL